MYFYLVLGTLPQAFRLLGGSSITHLGPEDLAANAGEELADTARLLSHVVDCLVVRLLRMSSCQLGTARQ